MLASLLPVFAVAPVVGTGCRLWSQGVLRRDDDEVRARLDAGQP